MQTGIIYYSRSGHSKRLAERLATELHGETLEILAPRYASRVIGYTRAAVDSLRQRLPADLSPPSVSEFDRVILCGPVWTSYPAVPLRALLHAGSTLPGSLSLFLTSGAHSPAAKAFEAASADLGRSLTATASLPNSAENTAQEERIISAFLDDFGAAAHLETPD